MQKRILIEKIILLITIMLFFNMYIASNPELIYELGKFNLPGDVEFINLIVKLDTPKKICAYMKENFEYEEHSFYALDPYMTWKLKKADCNDYVTLAIFISNLHGYEAYQVLIILPEKNYGRNQAHMIGIYVEDGKYTFSDCDSYFGLGYESIEEIMEIYYEWESYFVFDYDMNLIKKVNKVK